MMIFCFEAACRNPRNVGGLWFDEIKAVPKFKSVYVSKARAYEYYVHWCQRYKFNVKRSPNFYQDLEDMGVKFLRKQLKSGKKKYSVVICKAEVISMVSNFYSVAPKEVEDKIDWWWDNGIDLDIFEFYSFKHRVVST